MTMRLATANCDVTLPSGQLLKEVMVESRNGEVKIRHRNGEVLYESVCSAVRYGREARTFEIDVPLVDEAGAVVPGSDPAKLLVKQAGGCGCGGGR